MIKWNLTGANTPSPKYWWLNDESQKILTRGYLLEGESTQDAIIRITTASAKRLGMPELQAMFQECIERGWWSLSSPVWANMGTDRGLPISCYNVTIDDTMDSLIAKKAEVTKQTSLGGGTSGYFGNIRNRGAQITNNGKSNGPVPFMKEYDTLMEVTSQGGTRKGAFASYLNIDHADVNEFLNIKSVGDPIQNLFFGVTIPDYWMEEMVSGDADKRKIWAKVLESRQQKGMPYLFFSDNVNKNKPEIYKALDMTIWSSNLCTEIMLPSSEDESFVCCLSSKNLALYDEWKDTDSAKLLVYFLDGVMSEFIEKAEHYKFLETSLNFARNHRAIGIGVLGYHSYLQKNMIPFESWDARNFNASVFKELQEKTKKASKELGEVLGYAPIFEGVEGVEKFRHTTTMAVAPTTSSSAILGQVSAGIEPLSSNYYKAGLSKGNFIRRNVELEKLLEAKGKNTEDVWKTIMLAGGSVLGLDFLTTEEKEVFKTFKEINQVEIINQSISRQRYIDQGQSVNLNIPSSIAIKDVNKMYIDAWRAGAKSLYYQRSQSVSKELVTNLVSCSSCES